MVTRRQGRGKAVNVEPVKGEPHSGQGEFSNLSTWVWSPTISCLSEGAGLGGPARTSTSSQDWLRVPGRLLLL